MKIRIKRVDRSLPLPKFETPGACALDLYARINVIIQPNSIGHIPANVVFETPEGYMCLMTLRSSTPKKKGLHIPHGIGILDQDYCGDGDEAIMQVYNPSNQEININRGERIGQACFVRIDKPEIFEVEYMDNEDRGGFGSTGSNITSI